MGSMAPSPPPQMSLADLKALSVLGQGARGVVFHVVPADTASSSAPAGNPMAMALKAMSRAAARHKVRAPGLPCGADMDGHRRIWFERDVLRALRHPLLPSLRGVVATDAVVGFAIDRCPGGDLKSLLRRRPRFPDSVIRFYAAELVLALEHLHGLGVVYRDLKPENVLIQGSGHIMLVDFDLSTTLPPPPPPPPPDAATSSPTSPSSRHLIINHSKKKKKKKKKKKMASMISSCCFLLPSSRRTTESSYRSSRGSSAPQHHKSKSFVGTEDYVAPEIVAGSGHDHAVDCTRETFRRVLDAAPELPGERTPLRDLVARLLEKDPRKRLGAPGVKRHAFFRGVDWDRVLDVARPPFIPAPDEYNGGDSSRGEEAEALDVEKIVHEVFGSGGAADEETPAVKDGTEDEIDDDFSIFF
ncbi:hypothetical protein PR202_gb08981 [Eleusine coracana subsp. coracana]|uniref:non-specific serine/threonine protein kinase n=1 Tax=Eleusine coracana subsp. coracana TaxID=191504 RepID=A0AAV5EFS7_ELECO|nr:hypothetical protein PR202_gb08981 [Eleusine coracana subsp. coracana]